MVEPIVHQLTQGITPEKIALTVAVGSALGLFPIPTTTVLLCLLTAIVLRLNQPIIHLVNGMCTPLHPLAIIGLFRMGDRIYGLPHVPLNIRSLNQMFWILWDTPRLFVERFGTVAWHAIVAWAILAPFWMALVYAIALPALREITRLRAASALKPGGGPPPTHPVP